MFNIKQFQKNNSTLIQSVPLKELTSISTYWSEINGWFWKIKIKFALSVINNDFEIWDIIHLQFKQNLLIVWSIINVKKMYEKNQETLELEITWLSGISATLLTNAIYTDTASNIMKDLIDNLNTDYWFSIFSYDSSSIPNTVWNLSLDFSSYKTYKSAMEAVAETAGLYFFIDNDGKVYLQEKNWFWSHNLEAKQNVSSIVIDEDSRELVNSLILQHWAWTTPYSDSTSISTYWKREKFLNLSSEITNQATADIYWANYITKYKDKSKKISITVNNEYNFFDIKPWDLITVRNILYNIVDLQASKVKYWLETCTIELETFYSFSKEIFKN